MEQTMRAVIVTETGGPEVLKVRPVPRPEPGPGEVRVQVSTSGVNRADLLQRRGRYPVPEGYPEDILGLEFAGKAEAAPTPSSWSARRSCWCPSPATWTCATPARSPRPS